jgi:hypothetical protein
MVGSAGDFGDFGGLGTFGVFSFPPPSPFTFGAFADFSLLFFTTLALPSRSSL